MGGRAQFGELFLRVDAVLEEPFRECARVENHLLLEGVEDDLTALPSAVEDRLEVAPTRERIWAVREEAADEIGGEVFADLGGDLREVGILGVEGLVAGTLILEDEHEAPLYVVRELLLPDVPTVGQTLVQPDERSSDVALDEPVGFAIEVGRDRN